MVRPIVVRSGEAPLVEWRRGVRTRLHAAPDDAPSALCVLEQWCDPGAGAPTHTHFETEEIVTLLGGVADVWVDDAETRLSGGDSILFPPHSWHGFRNAGVAALHVLAVFAAAQPLVQYRDEHDQTVLEVAGRGRAAVDPHRSIHHPRR